MEAGNHEAAATTKLRDEQEVEQDVVNIIL